MNCSPQQRNGPGEMFLLNRSPRDGPRREAVAYAVETGASRVLKTLATQKDAVDWAKADHYVVHVAEVHGADRENPSHWREGVTKVRHTCAKSR